MKHQDVAAQQRFVVVRPWQVVSERRVGGIRFGTKEGSQESQQQRQLNSQHHAEETIVWLAVSSFETIVVDKPTDVQVRTVIQSAAVILGNKCERGTRLVLALE